MALTARDKSGTKSPVIGEGDHKYECVHNRGTLPKGVTWQTTHGVCVDAEGLVCIKQQGLGTKQFDTVAQPGDDEAWRKKALAGLRTTPEKCEPGRFIHPHDACFDKAGNIFPPIADHHSHSPSAYSAPPSRSHPSSCDCSFNCLPR